MTNTCRKPLIPEQQLNKIGTRQHTGGGGGGDEGEGERELEEE
jgi:hypothetical protein